MVGALLFFRERGINYYGNSPNVDAVLPAFHGISLSLAGLQIFWGEGILLP
jgi:hypothetical protein